MTQSNTTQNNGFDAASFNAHLQEIGKNAGLFNVQTPHVYIRSVKAKKQIVSKTGKSGVSFLIVVNGGNQGDYFWKNAYTDKMIAYYNHIAELKAKDVNHKMTGHIIFGSQNYVDKNGQSQVANNVLATMFVDQKKAKMLEGQPSPAAKQASAPAAPKTPVAAPSDPVDSQALAQSQAPADPSLGFSASQLPFIYPAAFSSIM